MGRIAYNKSSLKRERDQLSLYEQYLPSLDLKRQQLLLELKKARQAQAEVRETMEELRRRADDWLPLLAKRSLDVNGLVTVEQVKVGEQNLLGVRLPVLDKVEVAIKDYSFLSKPHWVDTLVQTLAEMVKLRLQVQILERRSLLLAAALRTVTQRVNLFEKILIPETKGSIRKIRLALADKERAGVIRSKLAKSKHQERRA